MRINLPNQITMGRLVLAAVVFFILLAGYDQKSPRPLCLDVCFGIFVVAALTDALDGYLARKQDQVTSLGRVLDPFVDKVLICGAFVFFASQGFVDGNHVNVTGVKAWMVVVILGRELLVTELRGSTESRGEPYGALAFGKLKMIMQSVTAAVILFAVAHSDTIFGSRPFVVLKTVLIWLT
ncbi:MAG: CDP-alcohol phosphatidyltransferase family protein, partial [Planctomycetota bacterium]